MNNLDASTRQVLLGNLLLIGCCAFYLAWWLLAFRPGTGVRGMKTGWLLIPASAAGLAAVVLSVKGVVSAPAARALFSGRALLFGGVAAYLILLIVTSLLLRRAVTTELFLIVGWAVLMLAEINALYGAGRFTLAPAVIFAAVTAAASLASLVCYMLYYRLGERAGFIDGTIPLVLTALVTAAVTAAAAF